MSMSVGAVETPTAWNPAPGASVNFARPLLNAASDVPKYSFFWKLESFDAAIKPKSRKSPSFGVPEGVTVKWNCRLELLGHSPVPMANGIEHIWPLTVPTTFQAPEAAL